MAFDIMDTELVLEDTAEMVLINPKTGEEMYDKEKGPEEGKVVFTLVGQANPKYLKAVEAMRKANKRITQNGNKDATLEEGRQVSVNFLASLSVSVENMTYGGKAIDSAEQFKELYSNEKLSWIREQVNTFLTDNKSFFKA
jgi:hypothetical protein